MPKIYRFLLLAVFFFSNSYAQDKTIDSLKIVLRNPKMHDTTKISTISEVMDYYSEQEKDYYYLNNMRGRLAMQNLRKKNTPELYEKYTKALAGYYSVAGSEYSYKETGRERGLAYHDKSIALSNSVKDYHSAHMGLIVKAALYTRIQQDDKAIPIIFKALKYFEKIKDTENTAYAYSALGHIYINQKKHKQAIAFNKKAIQYYDVILAEYEDDPIILSLKGKAYGNLAYSYASMKEYENAIVYCEKALSISKKLGETTLTGLLLVREAAALRYLSRFEESEKLLKEVLALNTSGESNQASVAGAYSGLGRLYLEKGDLKLAMVYADKSFALSKTTGSIDLQSQSAQLVYDVSKATKNYEKALEMYRFHEKIVDSSQIQASKNVLEQQQLKYDFEKKELNLKLAAEKKNAAKNNWLIGLSGLLLLFVLGGFFYYRNNKQKQEIAGLEKNQIKQKLLITQMNPHFIFNSIGNIQGLINDKKDKDAVDYLTKFSKLTRQILENSNENYISLEEEVEMTKNYLSIQQLLYSNKFSFKIDIEDNVDTENIFLPPMLTQPFIENAIKHGISNTENGKINIRFYLNQDKLFFEVTDNGRGFDSSKRTDNHKSLAMTITKERLVNYTRNQDFVVQTDNIKDNNENVVGAKVSFEIPYIYEN